MNNLWLNPALRNGGSVRVQDEEAGAAARDQRLRRYPTTREGALPATAPQRTVQKPVDRAGSGTRAEWHQLWLRAAAALLLVGSAAFSYVAWSDSARVGAAQALSIATQHPQRIPRSPTGDTARDTQAAADGDAVAAARTQVLALRQQNAELHQRLADLRARVDDPRTRPPENTGD